MTASERAALVISDAAAAYGKRNSLSSNSFAIYQAIPLITTLPTAAITSTERQRTLLLQRLPFPINKWLRLLHFERQLHFPMRWVQQRRQQHIMVEGFIIFIRASVRF